ncbi:hypothetical protein ACET3Z_022020 [Daucus carota]
MTKIANLLSLSLLCLVASVQCYGRNGFNPLEKLIKAQKSKRISTSGDELLNAEYSPVYVGPQDGLKEADKVESLPGQPDGAMFDQYSGYVTVDPVAGRALFYYFAQSQNSSTQPLVLWLNGDEETQYAGSVDYFWSHAMVSDEIHEGIILNCNFSAYANISDACESYLDQVNIGDIFGYDIYAPLCGSTSGSPSTSGFDPCTDDYIYTYLNTQNVQTSLHVNAPLNSWESCSDKLEWTDSPATVLPVIKELMNSGISVWLYSGDTDGVVPVTTTRYAIDHLQTSVKTQWYPWYTQAEVGGYAVGYENLTFVTVRGSGHFVPSYQPSRALALFSSFLAGELPPSNDDN